MWKEQANTAGNGILPVLTVNGRKIPLTPKNRRDCVSQVLKYIYTNFRPIRPLKVKCFRLTVKVSLLGGTGSSVSYARTGREVVWKASSVFGQYMCDK